MYLMRNIFKGREIEKSCQFGLKNVNGAYENFVSSYEFEHFVVRDNE